MNTFLSEYTPKMQSAIVQHEEAHTTNQRPERTSHETLHGVESTS